MTGFPWFPIGHAIACGTVGRLRAEGAGYQVLHDQTSDRLILYPRRRQFGRQESCGILRRFEVRRGRVRWAVVHGNVDIESR